ncbi:MAG: CBS domain-containing protein [Terriglobia bacterium]
MTGIMEGFMWIPKEIDHIATRLKEGGRVRGINVTVRKLLQMFKAERRGPYKVHDIRTALDSLGLETEPDFESAWIDSPVRIQMKNPSVPPTTTAEPTETGEGNDLEEGQAGLQAELEVLDSPQLDMDEKALPPIVVASEGVVETALSEASDPTFRIGSLPAANKELTTVEQDDDLKKAITKMLLRDYSQLPIMHGERTVKGMISWKSIASRYAIGGECHKVQHCREDAQVIDANGTLFDAIPTIVKHGYVLVRDQKANKITGIVTASDLSLQFQQLAEPFLLLREIELHIRQLFQNKVTADDLESLPSSGDSAPKPKSISDLSFGGYVRLPQRSEIWAKLSLNIDQASLTTHLEEVRRFEMM